MATVNPQIEESTQGTLQFLWEAMATGDTFNSINVGGVQGSFGFVQVTGTFGSGTVLIQGSNDNTNWVTLKDSTGSDLSFASAGGADFVTAAKHIRAFTSGGTSDDVDVRIVFRGR